MEERTVTGKAGHKSAKRLRKEREENFYRLTDKVCVLLEKALSAEETDCKELKQITGALKDLKELIWDKGDKSEGAAEPMTIRIEGDV